MWETLSTVMLSLGGALGEGAGQLSWSGHPPKAMLKMTRGRCSARFRPPRRSKGWRGGAGVKSVPLGTSASSAPERPLPCLALSGEIRVTHFSGVLAPDPLSSCWANRLALGRCPGARAQEGSSCTGLPIPPGTGMDRPGPWRESSLSPSRRLRLEKSKPSSPCYSKWTLMGKKRLERKALAFAGLLGFAEEK